MSLRRTLPLLLCLAGCSSEPRHDDDAGSFEDASTDAAAQDAGEEGSDASLDAHVDVPVDAAQDAQVDPGTPAVGVYRGTCDGSAAVWIDATRFLSFDDESVTWRMFAAGTDGAAVATGSFGAAIGVAEEADVEDATRVGDRVFVITSHGRNKDGDLERDRYRFFGFDLTGSAPTPTFVGSTSTLLDEMLVGANYAEDDEEARALLDERSKLDDDHDPDLAPKVDGTSIEGLTVLPDEATLAIGFRNPLLSDDALVVTLTNPSAVLAGATPAFGRIIRLDLGGLGIRSMTLDRERDLVWIIAGPRGSADSPFRLYSWSGSHEDAPVAGPTITPPANSGGPEVVLPIAGSPYLRVIYDQGAVRYSGTECKDLSAAAQRFTDVLVTAP